MTKRIAIAAVAAILVSVTAAFAAETNFKPANMSGSAPAEEGVSRARQAEEARSTEPTFWDKEGKRSGLADTAQATKNGFVDFFQGKWLKEQEEKYKARKGTSTDK